MYFVIDESELILRVALLKLNAFCSVPMIQAETQRQKHKNSSKTAKVTVHVFAQNHSCLASPPKSSNRKVSQFITNVFESNLFRDVLINIPLLYQIPYNLGWKIEIDRFQLGVCPGWC